MSTTQSRVKIKNPAVLKTLMGQNAYYQLIDVLGAEGSQFCGNVEACIGPLVELVSEIPDLRNRIISLEEALVALEQRISDLETP